MIPETELATGTALLRSTTIRPDKGMFSELDGERLDVRTKNVHGMTEDSVNFELKASLYLSSRARCSPLQTANTWTEPVYEHFFMRTTSRRRLKELDILVSAGDYRRSRKAFKTFRTFSGSLNEKGGLFIFSYACYLLNIVTSALFCL